MADWTNPLPVPMVQNPNVNLRKYIYWVEQLDACLRLVQKGRLSALIFRQQLFETLLAYPPALFVKENRKGFAYRLCAVPLFWNWTLGWLVIEKGNQLLYWCISRTYRCEHI